MKPVPTAKPSAYGMTTYYPMSSQTNPMASNYQIQSRPMSSQNTQLNAYGTPLYQSTPTTQRVVNTNPLTGEFPQNQPTPQPGPAPVASPNPSDALMAEIDNIYNSTMGYAGQLESSLRANQPGVEQGIESQYGAGVKSLETQKAAGERGLAQEEAGVTQRKEDALTAGRRLYNELMMGGRQRFGGASSASQAYGELTAREFQRGQAGTQQAFQTAMSKITDLKTNLQDRFASAMQTLESQKINAINEARRLFDEKLMEINRMRGEAGQNRSSMRLELLQGLRNQIYQIQLASATSAAALQQQQAQQQAVLNDLEQRSLQTIGAGQQAGQNMIASTTVNPTTQFSLGGANRPSAQTAYTGIRRDEELTGAINPMRREELFA